MLCFEGFSLLIAFTRLSSLCHSLPIMLYFSHFLFVLQVEGAVLSASEDGKNEVKGKFKLWYRIAFLVTYASILSRIAYSEVR